MYNEDADKGKTSYTLLERALDLDDRAAWDSVIEKYTDFINYVLGPYYLTSHDKDDVVQDIVINLAKNLSKYDRSLGRFRPWFARMIRNQCFMFLRKKQSHLQKMDAASGEYPFLDDTQAAEVEKKIESDWQAFIVNEALDNVKESFKGNAVPAFSMALNGASTQEICEKYNLTEGSLYTLKKRVKKQLMIEVDILTKNLELH